MTLQSLVIYVPKQPSHRQPALFHCIDHLLNGCFEIILIKAGELVGSVIKSTFSPAEDTPISKSEDLFNKFNRSLFRSIQLAATISLLLPHLLCCVYHYKQCWERVPFTY